MSRKKKSVFGFAAQLPSETINKNNESEQVNEQGKLNTKTEQTNVNKNDSINTKTEVEQENKQDKGFLEQFQKKRPTIEETHKRATFLIDKQLLKRLDRLAKKHPKGFKTHFINYCLQKGLDELE